MKDLRRKLVNAKPTTKGQYDDDSLLLILTNSLPDSFQSVIDDLNINSELSVDDQLKHLENKEERLRCAYEHREPALISRKKFSKSGRYLSETPKPNTDNIECFLCGEEHYLVNCRYLELCKKLVSDVKVKESK